MPPPTNRYHKILLFRIDSYLYLSLSEIEKNYYWIDRDNKFIQYLNRALDMIDDGTFGICNDCGNLINKERLLEVPHTISCFDCKSKSA